MLTAAHGDEAILVCAQHGGDVQLLLTDVVLPRMSGRVLAQSLLKIRPALEVLYLSGYRRRDRSPRCARRGDAFPGQAVHLD